MFHIVAFATIRECHAKIYIMVVDSMNVPISIIGVTLTVVVSNRLYLRTEWISILTVYMVFTIMFSGVAQTSAR